MLCRSAIESEMMKSLLLTLVVIPCLSVAQAFEPPANSKLLLVEDFSDESLPKGWSVQTGTWETREGFLHGIEITAENHAAAARRLVETKDAVYDFKFRLSEGTKGFHFGFDPARGELEKRGHLFSIIVTPADWRILKHVDKDQPKEDPNEILATAKHDFEAGRWYHIRVTTWGTTVKAQIEGLDPLTAMHPTFAVRKPTLVFRVSGSGVDIDDVRVWEPAE